MWGRNGSVCIWVCMRGCTRTAMRLWRKGMGLGLWVCGGDVGEGTDTPIPPHGPRSPAGGSAAAAALMPGHPRRPPPWPRPFRHRPGAGLPGSHRPCCVWGGPGARPGRGRRSPEGRERAAGPAGKPRTPPSHRSRVAAVWGPLGRKRLRPGPAPWPGNKSLINISP